MYDTLLKECEEEDVDVIDVDLGDNIKGLYCDSIIAINKRIPTIREKSCVLSEELGHHYTSSGDILNQSCVCNRKQERLARAWGYERLVSLMDLINAYKEGVSNRYELAEYLNVTEGFLDRCITYYKEKHGLFYEVNSYAIYFEPLGVFKKF